MATQTLKSGTGSLRRKKKLFWGTGERQSLQRQRFAKKTSENHRIKFQSKGGGGLMKSLPDQAGGVELGERTRGRLIYI